MPTLTKNYSMYNHAKLAALLERANNDLELFKNVIDSISSAFFIIEPDGKISYTNKYTKQLFRKNLEGKYFEETFECHTSLKEKIGEVIQNGFPETIEGELLEFAKEDGGMGYFLMNLYPRMEQGTLCGWILIIQDYSEQYHKTILSQRNDNLDSMGNISSSIAHEIKNPLGAISIHLQLMKKTMCKINLENVDMTTFNGCREKLINYIQVIEEEMQNMNNVISMFLNNFKNESNTFQRNDLNLIIKSVMNFIIPHLKEKDIRHTLKLSKEPLFIACENSSISHVIINIINNAIEELCDGGNIQIKSYKKDGRVRVSITDDGKGISEDMKEKIFNPYITSKKHGTGIGLAISDKIMQVHKGSLVLDYQYKKGARFILDFPAMANEQYLLELLDIHQDIKMNSFKDSASNIHAEILRDT